MQLRVTPLGEVELLSTHDQLLGGPSGQSYLGCRFPADIAYAREITAEASKIGAAARATGRARALRHRLRRRARRAGAWAVVRHRAQSAQGRDDAPVPHAAVPDRRRLRPGTALFTAPSGREKYLVASDHVESDQLRGLTIDDLFDIAVRHRLHFHQGRQTGIVFHMMSAVGELGRVGLTAVDDTPDLADQRYRKAEAVLVEESQPGRETPLPAI